MAFKHNATRRFDDGVGYQLTAAFAAGDMDTINHLVADGGKHENRRGRCEALFTQFLRRGGELPLPQLEPLPYEEIRNSTYEM